MRNSILKIFLLAFSVLAACLILFFYFSKPVNRYNVQSDEFDKMKAVENVEKPKVHEFGDIEPQKPLIDPPEEIKAIYATSQSAGNPGKMDNFIKLMKKAGINAIIFDIKDYSGHVFYDSGLENVEKYKAEKVIIPKINALIKKLHDENIYVIARIVVFQDPVLAAARPDLAVKNRYSRKIWRDNNNLAWVDPSSQEAWDYIAKIARNASERGFDEINFDYIRFPSDGQLSAMQFPFYEKKGISKEEAVKEFFTYLRTDLKNIKISADLFGLTTSGKDDLGIGQVIEDGYRNFDYISPMVYPSHYAKWFIGFEEPARHPYEVVKYAIESAVKKLDAYKTKEAAGGSKNKNGEIVKIRPWIQAFNMGDIYDVAKIKVQIKASDEAGGTGWMLWHPANNYLFLNDF